MANDGGASYPVVTAKGWHAIRAKAFASPSTKFTPAVVRSLLDLGNDASAQTNVLRGMRSFGIVNDDGSLTELGTRWRVDETYAQACREILEKVYPEDLRILATTARRIAIDSLGGSLRLGLAPRAQRTWR